MESVPRQENVIKTPSTCNHCTGYAPCENGDWLLFAPGDGVMHRVIGYRSGLLVFRSTFCIYFGRILSIYTSERYVSAFNFGK